MSALLSGETLEYFGPRSQYIFDSAGNLVALQNPRAVGADFRPIVPMTWAERPTVNIPPALFLFTDVGSSGTLMRYANSRWRPLAGQAQLASLGAAVTGIGTSETIVLQTLLPAGALQTNDTIRIWVTATKSGTTDAGRISVRIGTAGTTADTVITGLSARSLNTSSGLSGGGIYDVKLISATSAQSIGGGANGASSYTASTSAGTAAATTITDSSANSLYVTLTMSSSGATDTVAIQSGQIQLITP